MPQDRTTWWVVAALVAGGCALLAEAIGALAIEGRARCWLRGGLAVLAGTVGGLGLTVLVLIVYYKRASRILGDVPDTVLLHDWRRAGWQVMAATVPLLLTWLVGVPAISFALMRRWRGSARVTAAVAGLSLTLNALRRGRRTRITATLGTASRSLVVQARFAVTRVRGR